MLSITNSGCSYCTRVIEKQLTKMPGIKDVAVSYLTDTVLVEYDPERTTTGNIRDSIKKIDYDAVERH
jgi:copper chaperone CopZ